MFTDDFLDSLPEDPKTALLAICNQFFSLRGTVDDADLSLEAFAIFQAYCDAHSLDYPLSDPTTSSNTRDMVSGVSNQFSSLRDTLNDQVEMERSKKFLETSQDRFNGRFGVVFSYEFSENEHDRIQSLINELRNQISVAEQFESKHKARIMGKLEGLQREMHRHMSSLDQLWGVIGDAGVVLGKLGTEGKPFVDRVKEIIKITWEVQVRAEDLPTSTRLPFLRQDVEKLDSDDS